MNADPTSDRSNFKIGAVARLTGVAPDTLRVWERRHGAVAPRRSAGGDRLYSSEDVARLGLIKRLVDAGHAIGTVATLGRDALQARWDTVRSAQPVGEEAVESGRARICLVGPTLALRLAPLLDANPARAPQIVGHHAALDDFEPEAGRCPVDVLVVETVALYADVLTRAQQLRRLCGARRLVLAYGYANRAALQRAMEQGVELLRIPFGPADVWRVFDPRRLPVVMGDPPMEIAGALTAAAPARRFDDGQLARVSTLASAINCECPQHLAGLIDGLVRFEQYSAECENRNLDDAAVHAYLHVMVATARATVEQALQRLLAFEQIDIASLADESRGD